MTVALVISIISLIISCFNMAFNIGISIYIDDNPNIKHMSHDEMKHIWKKLNIFTLLFGIIFSLVTLVCSYIIIQILICF